MSGQEVKKVITLSGVPGSGTTTIGQMLSKELNLKMVYIGEIFRDLAKEYDMSLDEFGKFADNNPEIDRRLDEKQLEYGRMGNIILEGRLSGCIMKINNIDSFKILLIADLDTRVKRIMNRENKSYEQVRTEIETRESGEVERYKKLYNLDYKDHSHYDVIIDTTNLTPEQIVIKIIENLKL
jgi:predicted cytidylate kinase